MKYYLLTLLSFAVLIFSCKRTNVPEELPDPAFSRYVSSFTGGVISCKSPILIELALDPLTAAEPGTEAPAGLITLNPRVDGKMQWVNPRTLAFVPKEKLRTGETYTVAVALDRLLEVPDKFAEMRFKVKVISQSISVSDLSVNADSYDAQENRSLSGTLITADFAENVEQVVQVKDQNRMLPLIWEHDASGTRHTFRADSIIRGERPRELTVSWDGKSMGTGQKGEEKTELPAAGDFKVTGLHVVQQPEQVLVISFSDALLPGQDLNGLVRVGKSGEFRYMAEYNKLKVYLPEQLSGEQEVQISGGIRNSQYRQLKDAVSMQAYFEDVRPAVRLIGKGSIVPSSDELIIPFEAVNLKAVDLRVIKILTHNVHQFFQQNSYEDESGLKQVARLLLQKRIDLQTGSYDDLKIWKTYRIDLARLIEVEPGAIYRIQLRFRKEYSVFGKEDSGQAGSVSLAGEAQELQELEREKETWDRPGWYSDYYYPDNFEWDERNDPGKESYYYSERFPSRNLFATNLAVIAKGGDNLKMSFAVTNLKTTEPEEGVTLKIYDFQKQLLETVKTGNDGLAEAELKRKPFLLVASKNDQMAYLKLDDGSSLSLSNFDVSGDLVQKGVKGTIYGERGVWRPGDRIYLTFILEDPYRQVPEGHPVILELINPRGQTVSRQVGTEGKDGFYCFTAGTEADAPTGNWTALIRLGGRTFTKKLKVETIKPNRLKIDLQLPAKDNILQKGPVEGSLAAAWLHGGIAKGLKAKVTVNFSPAGQAFKEYPGYVFTDPAREFNPQEQQVFEGRMDAQGTAPLQFSLPDMPSAPGLLNAFFTTRVFEETGDFSIDVRNYLYAPFSSFVGIRLPASESNWYKTDTSYPLSIVTLGPDGEKLSRRGLEVTVYKIGWRWWWDAGEDDLARYVNDKYQKAVVRAVVNTVSGEASFPVYLPYHDWQDNGRYLIYVKDPESGHSAGITAYFSKWGEWGTDGMQQASTMLSMKTDRETYRAGEKVSVSIPSGKNGKALVSLENGSEILDLFWVKTSEKNTVFSFDVKPGMAPNLFVHVSLIQPHEQTENDAPVRLYGVVPVKVEDPATHLEPQIRMPGELAPEKDYEITVSEKSGKEMTYTLAVVDEGLLSLTRFETPDPWASFYAREALGVRTWDFYDDVIGAYGARLEKAFAVGGDGSLLAAGRKKVSRFEPVVRFAGPFTLGKNDSRTHRFSMPNYVGEVRVMVVAGHERAYGKAEKQVKVQSPVMLLATLPRVLGPGEEVSLPVNVFAMKPDVRDVQVSVAAGDLFTVSGATSKQVRFETVGDRLVTFGLKVKEQTGTGKVKIVATSGGFTASQEITMEIRPSNTRVLQAKETLIPAGGNWEAVTEAPGMKGTNQAAIELSEIPPLNLGSRLDELIHYPHGCIEQIVSAAFPQLMLGRLTEVPAGGKKDIEENIRSTLARVNGFQLNDGGLAYWPGSPYASSWGTSYAGHFMLKAEEAGYSLPFGLKEKWIKYQKEAVRNWTSTSAAYERSDLIQSYRLYTLALAGQPELGAMNRLKEEKSLSLAACWRLAAAYVLAGRPEVAGSMISRLSREIPPYRELAGTYGSDTRDMAMIAETLVLLDRKTEAFPLVTTLAHNLASGEWMNTQSAAWSLIAIALFSGDGYPGQGQINAELTVNNATKEAIRTAKVVWKRDLPLQDKLRGAVKVQNNSDKPLYVRVTSEGIPLAGDTISVQQNLLMEVHYTDMTGQRIDPSKVRQGTDLVAEISIGHPGQREAYRGMALTTIFPSGWEVLNGRLNDAESPLKSDPFEYQDIRDDRVNTYFDLRPGERKTFRVLVNAAYEGKYYLPPVQCEAMYDNRIQARRPGRWVEVVR